MRITFRDIGGTVVKEDDRYVVKDNTTLSNLVLSSTKLNPNKSTTGHAHKGQEEIYFFVKGSGTMEIDEDRLLVFEEDIVLIEAGAFHRVNAGSKGVEFVCVFPNKRRSDD